jgi:hypothetical protein
MPQQELRENFARVAGLFAAGGFEIDTQTRRYLEPLLSGQMTPEEHEVWLKAQLAELTHE